MFDFSDPKLWIDFSISAVILAAVALYSVFAFKRKLPLLILFLGYILMLASRIFGLPLAMNITTVATFSVLILVTIINVASVRPYVTNPISTASKGSGRNKRGEVEKVYDRYELCSKIATAVITLSKSKTGALITFEMDDRLDNLVNTPGTVLNAPVVPELLQSIFYEGTRLHDGAVIIRRDLIYSAAAFFPATTKPLTGKFGSRHRAAIGISEISDSVTVVVSEETGRISFAVDGELIHSSTDTFERMLQDYLITDHK